MSNPTGEQPTKSLSGRFVGLLKFLSTVKGDLSNITAPPSFLAPCSVVETPQCWAQRPEVFIAPSLEKDPSTRSLLVLKMFLTGLRSQTYIAGAPNVSIKKPLNAFLGELFLAKWTDPKSNSTTRLIAEQVSHHPPITAMHLSSKAHGVRADGYARVEMTFSGAINIRQIGHTVLRIERFDEDYLLPFPDIQVRGFMSRCFYPEILGTYSIISSSGYVSEITFSGEGLLGRGTRNSFKARVYHRSDPENSSKYLLSGVWSKEWEIKDAVTGEFLEKYVVDSEQNTPAAVQLDGLDDQDPWESRRAWRDVIARLNEGDYSGASAAKHQVEEAQRRMRQDEKESGVTWQPLLFRNAAGDQHGVFHRLAEGTNHLLLDSQTKGVWRVDEVSLDGLQKPYRKGLTPKG